MNNVSNVRGARAAEIGALYARFTVIGEDFVNSER